MTWWHCAQPGPCHIASLGPNVSGKNSGERGPAPPRLWSVPEWFRTGARSTIGVWWEQIPPPALRLLCPTPKSRSESRSPHSPPLHTQRAFKVVRFKIKLNVGYFNFPSHFQPLGCMPVTLGSFLPERRVLELIFSTRKARLPHSSLISA